MVEASSLCSSAKEVTVLENRPCGYQSETVCEIYVLPSPHQIHAQLL